MTLSEAKTIIADVHKRSPKAKFEIFRANKELVSFVKDLLKGTPGENLKITEQCYWVLHDLRDFPKCYNDECTNRIHSFHGWGYTRYCSQPCSAKCKKHKAKVASVFMDKYGKPNALIQDWVLEKSHGKEAREKYDATCLSHGYTTPMRCDRIKNKWTKSNNDNNGGIGWQVEKSKLKAMNTNMKLYNAPHAIQNPEIFAKCIKRWFYAGMYFSSSYELYYYMYLRRNNRDFIFQPKFPIPFIWKGEEHAVFPDFYLCDTKEYIDLKGGHFFSEDGSLRDPFDKSKEANDKARARYDFMMNHGIKLVTIEDLEKLGISEKNHMYIRRFCKFLEEHKLYYDKDISDIDHRNIGIYMQDALKDGKYVGR